MPGENENCVVPLRERRRRRGSRAVELQRKLRCHKKKRRCRLPAAGRAVKRYERFMDYLRG